MYSKVLPRRKTAHTMHIGEAVSVRVDALAREDDQCPNIIELTIGDPGAQQITIRMTNLHGMNPKISVDAPRDVRITHESCDVLRGDD